MACHTINQKFVENLHRQGGIGKYQEFADDALRGFGVKVIPQGGIAHYYRWTQPNGKHGHKVVGNFPGMASSATRELAKKHSATVDHSRDNEVTIIAKQAARESNAQRAKVVPTVAEFLAETYTRA